MPADPTGGPADRRLRRVLREAGVRAVYGEPAEGLAVTPVAPELAPLLALAHEKVFGGAAAVHRPDGTLVLGARWALSDPGRPLPSGAPHLSPAALEESDLVALSRRSPQGWGEVPDGVLRALAGRRAPVVLAGPGVVAERAVPGLHALAAAAGLGVLNTWGAKGVFDWRSRHHWATVGLQERDLDLGGLRGSDAVVTVGLDPLELPGDPGAYGPVVPLEPWMLDPLSEYWSRPAGDVELPPLRTRLADVTQEGWRSTGRPMPPSQVTRSYSTLLGGQGGLVAADPGVSGYWLARTYPTSRLGEALVPGERDVPGFSLACAVLARRADPDRPVLALADAPLQPAHHALRDLARSWGVPVALECWDPDGPMLGPEEHSARLADALADDRPSELALATDSVQLGRMTAVAGRITAWGLGSEPAPGRTDGG